MRRNDPEALQLLGNAPTEKRACAKRRGGRSGDVDERDSYSGLDDPTPSTARELSAPLSRVRRFSDPDEYTGAVRWTKAELVVTKPGRFSSKLTSIALSRTLAHRFTEALPRVLRSYHASNRALIFLNTERGAGLFAGAAEFPSNSILRLRDGDSSFLRSTGSARWGTVSMPLEDMEALASTFGGNDFMPPRESVVVTPNAGAMARLQKIHAAAGELAEQAPDVIAVPEAARGLEQSLLAALANCLVTQGADRRETGSQQRKAIMRRFYEMMEAHPEGVFHTLEICKAIGVSSPHPQLLLQREIGDESLSVFEAATIEFDAQGAPTSRSAGGDRYDGRHRTRLLGPRSLRFGLSELIQGASLRDASSRR